MTRSLTNCWAKVLASLGTFCVHSFLVTSSPLLASTTAPRELQVGSSHENMIGPGQVDVYTVALQKDQFLQAAVKKKGVDVTLSLIDPTARVLLKIDIPRTFGLESFSWIPETSGQYRVEVRKSERSHETGVYELSVAPLRSATLKDKSRIAAENALNDALNQEFGNASNDPNTTIQLFSTAAKLWRELGQGPTYEEAMCLHRIGSDWLILNDQQNALKYLNQALAMRQAIGDLPGTAETLHNLGGVYANSSANRKALDVLNQALSIERKLGYRQAEVATLNSIGTIYGAMGDTPRAMD
jgi:tetratricopeptide (TPR) repeat protein